MIKKSGGVATSQVTANTSMSAEPSQPRRLSFTVPGQPMAWQRARRCGNMYFDSKEQTNYKSLVALFAREGLKNAILPLGGTESRMPPF